MKFDQLESEGPFVPTESDFERSLDEESYPIFIYLHGISFDRTGNHRIQVFKRHKKSTKYMA